MTGTRCIFLARHGEAHTVDDEGKIRNYSDGGLSGTGLTQAEALRDFFNGIELAEVHSSDLRRSVETAQIVTRERGLTVYTDANLREFSIGKFEGKGMEELVKEYFPSGNSPEALAEFRSRVMKSSCFPGGESIQGLHDRVIRSWARILERTTPGAPILVVAHGGVNRVILGKALRLPMEMEYLLPVDQDPAAVNLILYPGNNPDPARGIIRLLNHTPYNPLKRDLRPDRMMLSLLGIEENFSYS